MVNMTHLIPKRPSDIPLPTLRRKQEHPGSTSSLRVCQAISDLIESSPYSDKKREFSSTSPYLRKKEIALWSLIVFQKLGQEVLKVKIPIREIVDHANLKQPQLEIGAMIRC